MPEMHHSGITADEATGALRAAIDVWNRAGCDCCSPTPLDDALDGMRDEATALRRFGVEVALSGQWLEDENEASQ